MTSPAHTIEEEVASTSMDASIRANAVHHCGPPSNLPHLLLRQRALPPKRDLARVLQLNHSQLAGHIELGQETSRLRECARLLWREARETCHESIFIPSKFQWLLRWTKEARLSSSHYSSGHHIMQQ